MHRFFYVAALLAVASSAGCAGGPAPGAEAGGGEVTYATACGAMSARCDGGDAAACERAAAACAAPAGLGAGLEAQGGGTEIVPVEIGGECSNACCAMWTRCVNTGETTPCNYCTTNCP